MPQSRRLHQARTCNSASLWFISISLACFNSEPGQTRQGTRRFSCFTLWRSAAWEKARPVKKDEKKKAGKKGTHERHAEGVETHKPQFVSRSRSSAGPRDVESRWIHRRRLVSPD